MTKAKLESVRFGTTPTSLRWSKRSSWCSGFASRFLQSHSRAVIGGKVREWEFAGPLIPKWQPLPAQGHGADMIALGAGQSNALGRALQQGSVSARAGCDALAMR